MKKFLKVIVTLTGIAALIGGGLYFLLNILKKYYLEDYDDEDFDNDFYDDDLERDYVTLGETDGKKEDAEYEDEAFSSLKDEAEDMADKAADAATKTVDAAKDTADKAADAIN